MSLISRLGQASRPAAAASHIFREQIICAFHLLELLRERIPYRRAGHVPAGEVLQVLGAQLCPTTKQLRAQIAEPAGFVSVYMDQAAQQAGQQQHEDEPGSLGARKGVQGGPTARAGKAKTLQRVYDRAPAHHIAGAPATGAEGDTSESAFLAWGDGSDEQSDEVGGLGLGQQAPLPLARQSRAAVHGARRVPALPVGVGKAISRRGPVLSKGPLALLVQLFLLACEKGSAHPCLTMTRLNCDERSL